MEDNKDSNGINNEQNNENANQYQSQNQMNNQQYNNQQQSGENQYNNQQPQENQYNNQQQPGQSLYNQQPNYQSQNNNQSQNQQYQYSGQPQFRQSYNNYQQQPDNNNGMAIGSLVCGIISILVNCCTAWFISLPTAIAGIILGIMTIKNNKAGRTMAIIGIVLSSIGALIGIIVLIGCAIVSNNRSLFDQFYREFEMEFDNFNY
jgi:hypothetical protein